MLAGEENSGQMGLRRNGQSLEVSAPIPALSKALCTINHAAVEFGSRIRLGKATAPFYFTKEINGENVLMCWAGLEPIVQEVARREGVIVDRRFQPLAPLPEFPQEPSSGVLLDHPFLDCIQKQERALIRVNSSQISLARLISQVAAAWPELKIAVAVTRIEDARRFRDQLREYGCKTIAVTSKNRVPDEWIGNVVVATYTGLGHTGIELEKRDVVFVVNAVEALGKNGRYCLRYARKARFFGFLDQRASLSPQDRDTLRLLFGFHELIVDRHGTGEKFSVLPLNQKFGVRLPEGADELTVKRLAVWENPCRNRRIAYLAYALNEREEIAKEPDLRPLDQLLPQEIPYRVFVLVENLDHASNLSDLLPDWPILARPGFNPSGLPESALKRILALPEPFNGHLAIITSAALSQLPLIDQDIILRADAGCGLPPLPSKSSIQLNRYLKNQESQDRGELAIQLNRYLQVWLLDIEDRQHPILRQWVRQRRSAYKERGWFGINEDPVQVRVSQFLNSRPKEDAWIAR